MNTRKYLLVPSTEAGKINFAEVLTTSQETALTSVAQDKFLIKWEGETPPSVLTLNNTEGPYNFEELSAILSGPAWTTYSELG
jgi:hypothetical protein